MPQLCNPVEILYYFSNEVTNQYCFRTYDYYKTKNCLVFGKLNFKFYKENLRLKNPSQEWNSHFIMKNNDPSVHNNLPPTFKFCQC